MPVSNTLCITYVRGKVDAHQNCFMVKPKKVAPVTRTSLRTTGSAPVDSRQFTPSVYHYVPQ